MGWKIISQNNVGANANYKILSDFRKCSRKLEEQEEKTEEYKKKYFDQLKKEIDEIKKTLGKEKK